MTLRFSSLVLLGLLASSISLAQGHGHSQREHDNSKHDHGKHGHGKHGHGEHDSKHGDLHAPGHHHDFSDVERWVAVFDAPERDGWQKPEQVVELMELAPGMHVADLGAGTGYFLPHLAAAVGPDGRVFGLDIEEKLVAHMNQRAEKAGLANVEARVVPTDSPGLADNSLDRLLVVNTWHHLDDRPTYAQKIGRVLKAGGRLVIVDLTLEAEQGPPKEHRLPAERVIAELEAGGLEATVVEETLPNQYVVIAKAP